MELTAHAGIGWLLAEAGMADDRFRRMVFLAAVLPDLDAVPLVFGYSEAHHMWTHNLLFSLLVSTVAAVYCRQYRIRSFAFTQLAFYSHYFGDYFFTQWPLTFFWPFSTHGFVSKHAYSYFSRINESLELASLIVIALLAVIFKRTPLEVLSPWLDHKFTDAIREAVGKPFRTKKK